MKKLKKRDAVPMSGYLTGKTRGKIPQNLPRHNFSKLLQDAKKSNMYFIQTQLQHYFVANTHK